MHLSSQNRSKWVTVMCMKCLLTMVILILRIKYKYETAK